MPSVSHCRARGIAGWMRMAVLVLLAGCATGLPPGSGEEARGPAPTCGGVAVPAGWPDLSSWDTEALLAPFFTCGSPAEFVRLQRAVDMAGLVRRLEEGAAVRLGALGPVVGAAGELLNAKRAAFLVACVHDHGPALGEVFALFVLQSASDQDVKQVLRALAQDRRLGQTLGGMAVVREQLGRRGLLLADFEDRPVRPGEDVARGVREGLGDVVSSSPLFEVGASVVYAERRRQLPEPYRQALDQVQYALVERAFRSGSVALGVVDEVTFGVPLGVYYLAAGMGQGVAALAQGEYEKAARELTPAALLVALYAGGKGAGALAETRGSLGGVAGETRLGALAARVEEWKATAQRLREQLGVEGVEALARYIQADPEAALLVAEGGEEGARALGEAKGDVGRARAWLSQAKGEEAGRPRAVGGVGKGGVAEAAAALAEEGGPPQEVLEHRLEEAEREAGGARLSRAVEVLRKQLAALREKPPVGAGSHPLWGEYVRYGEERLGELEQDAKGKGGKEVEPPLKWDGYQRMRGLVTRGLRFEREMVKLLREDAARPRAERRLLGDFDKPRVEAYVGVWKPEAGLRFADVLVIEEGQGPGGAPRVETFSFKSRDLSRMNEGALKAQMKADAREAMAYYGETLDIRRPTLKPLLREGNEVAVPRVRLIYEGGSLKPGALDLKDLKRAVSETEAAVPGVEVLFQ